MSKGIMHTEIDSYSADIFTVTLSWDNSINEKAMKTAVDREVPIYTLHNRCAKVIGYKVLILYLKVLDNQRKLWSVFSWKLYSNTGEDEEIQGTKVKNKNPA